MPDRLDELLRQRALLQQHLAWLDREIQAAQVQWQGEPAPTPVTPRPPAPASFLPAPPTPATGYLSAQAAIILQRASVPTAPAAPTGPLDDSPATAAAADAILGEYQVKPDALKSDVRRGCFVYFFIALALLAGVVAILYIVLPSSPPPS